MNTSFSFRTMTIGLLLVALIVAGRLAFYFHGNAVEAGEQVKQQEKTLAQQSGLITTLRADDARNRAMMAEQQRIEQQLRQQGEIYQRALREALKNDKCGNSPMPAAVIDLLQQNAAGARASRPVTP
ncbi:hypothetical protein [Serratia entomophila]|uniref:hypothetical protein n=1 Tax=Serratia entomophila TaxID=42906 RepID=UPI002177C5DC|nr:hypothetical protein [Serratia entomophila]CAI0826774.1 Protein of uncharacterised function (DUF2570) [Serratia entomophila]CAI1657702.1 Protein of uncharacterised function (DUF2570) [Serratia entomophila]CAI1784686.1 Protein of uncharacterised function (DUF2570) [Serratia entomophila]CAI1924597.1 Protein of uncharacterised function (DUF2570) [Serratia entomophila]